MPKRIERKANMGAASQRKKIAAKKRASRPEIMPRITRKSEIERTTDKQLRELEARIERRESGVSQSGQVVASRMEGNHARVWVTNEDGKLDSKRKQRGGA